MAAVTFDGVNVHRCTRCQGLFFDEFEKEELLKLKGADDIDMGDPKTGRSYNRVDRVDCPRCYTQMIRMVDLEQPHIWFEHCTVCGGSFFDAGEFKDLAHHTMADFFRRLTSRSRG